jgi:hypothetical protein
MLGASIVQATQDSVAVNVLAATPLTATQLSAGMELCLATGARARAGRVPSVGLWLSADIARRAEALLTATEKRDYDANVKIGKFDLFA